MKIFRKIAILGAVTAGILAVAPVEMALAQSGEQYAGMRRAVMKEFKAHNGAIKKYLKGNKNPKKAARLNTPADIELRAMAMAGLADRLHTMFAKKTSLNDLPGKTGAKPEIWTNWKDFYAKTQEMKKLAGALEVAAATGDKGKIGAAFKTFGKQGCGGCHKLYRKKLKKKK